MAVLGTLRSVRAARLLLGALNLVPFLVGCRSTGVTPPMAAVRPVESTLHGVTRVDNYAWLRERDNPEVIRYLEAENHYTDRVMKGTKRLQETLYAEMKGRMKETDLSVPTPVDEYYYYTRTFEGKQYPVHCRKKGSLDAAEEVLLDINELAAGHDYYRIGAFEPSPDHRLLAYSFDTAGSEMYTLKVKDLGTGALMSDEVPNTYYGVVWGNDNRTLFYTTLDDAKRPDKAWRHVLGGPANSDAMVHEEKDERFHVGLDKTRSRKFILLELDSQITSEIRWLDADNPMSAFQVIEPRRQGIEYKVDHRGDSVYIVTNDEALNFRLMKAPVESPSRANWTEVLPHRPDVLLEGIDAFEQHLAVYERSGGLQKVRVRRVADNAEHYIQFPEPVYAVWASSNEQFKTDNLRFMYTSMVTPRSIFDYDMNTRRRTLLKRDEVLGGYDPKEYVTERIFARSRGVEVPVSLVYRKDFKKDGKAPALLYGYGSYGATMEPTFSSDRLSLLDRGFVFAIAHIRGGQEFGRSWYEDGKLLNKRHTFEDFIACAEALIRERYTSSDRLAIMGGSAGGLLMGAVTNMRPDLFNVVVAQVPFVDVVNTMLDESIPLTVIEYEEWGNPNEERFFKYMLDYSPYDNVEAKAYPHLLVTTGLNDPRVAYWEPAKWVAKLRATRTDGNVLLLKTNMGAGHGGASGRYERLKERAFEYAFILDRLGIGA